MNRNDWTSFLMYLWRRTGSGVTPFCELAKSIWNPATARYPAEEEARQERLL
jgi:hypothetical protein